MGWRGHPQSQQPCLRPPAAPPCSSRCSPRARLSSSVSTPPPPGCARYSKSPTSQARTSTCSRCSSTCSPLAPATGRRSLPSFRLMTPTPSRCVHFSGLNQGWGTEWCFLPGCWGQPVLQMDSLGRGLLCRVWGLWCLGQH